MKKSVNKSIEDVKTSIENKVREEMEMLFDSSLEEISGGSEDISTSEDEKHCECIAFAKA